VGTFGIIIGSVFGNDEALVEQLVIGLCGVMAIIAFLVMVFKGVLINAARRASKTFLTAYNELDVGDKKLDALYGKEEIYDDSPLYRVYAQAVEELRHRMSPAVGAEFAGLEDKAMNAIRASLDARMVREGQRLNANMVLLTIAISGGPFIGLLGTVVGVMVTFAGIAAAGEVNINAIAPGMAAALLATVAGLGVAIPALFGYNYLGSRIKELEADMQVFADELLARIGEVHGV
jgi:biopolymer transport protein ExbB